MEFLHGFTCPKGSKSVLDCDRKVDATRIETRIHGRILPRGQVALENDKLKFVGRHFVNSRGFFSMASWSCPFQYAFITPVPTCLSVRCNTWPISCASTCARMACSRPDLPATN